MKQDRKSSLLPLGAAVLLLSFSACGGSGGGTSDSPPSSALITVPKVLSNNPMDRAIDAPLNGSVSATFSEPMDSATLTARTFTLTTGAVGVPGTMLYANSKVDFTPVTPLESNRLYTATITTEALSAKGVALAANHSWSFSTGITVPKVLTNTPVDHANGTSLNGSVSATFSEPMDPATLTALTFTLTSGTVGVPGTLLYANSKVMFTPAAHLASSRLYTATITTGAMSARGVALAADRSWSFTTGSTVAVGLPVQLGQAGTFVILAKTGISTVPTSAVTGNLGVSPAAATYITGFSLAAHATNVYSTSPQVTGKIYTSNYAVPTPANLTTAVEDMLLAFTSAAGRAPDVTELGAGNIGGKTLPPGVYKWGTGLLIPTDVTLKGSATDVWIFQIAKDLTLSSGVKVTLAGGALAKNVFWQVAGLVALGTTAHCEGVVLTQTAVTLRTGASINGRLLAQTRVNLDHSTVVEPAP